MLYILKHNPHLFVFKESKLSPQRYKNNKYWSSWRMVHLTPQTTRASAHDHPALPFAGKQCQVASCAIGCRLQIFKRNKFLWMKSTFLCSPTPSPSKSCWFWGCAHCQHLYFSIVCLPRSLLCFSCFRNHCKYSSQWRCIFFLSWQSSGEASASGHLPATVIRGHGRRGTEIGALLSDDCPCMTMKMEHHCRSKREVWISSTVLAFGRKFLNLVLLKSRAVLYLNMKTCNKKIRTEFQPGRCC